MNKIIIVGIEYAGKPILVEFVRQTNVPRFLGRTGVATSYFPTISSYNRLMKVLSVCKVRTYPRTKIMFMVDNNE